MVECLGERDQLNTMQQWRNNFQTKVQITEINKVDQTLKSNSSWKNKIAFKIVKGLRNYWKVYEEKSSTFWWHVTESELNAR